MWFILIPAFIEKKKKHLFISIYSNLYHKPIKPINPINPQI